MKKSSPLRCALLWHLPLRAAENQNSAVLPALTTFLKKRRAGKCGRYNQGVYSRNRRNVLIILWMKKWGKEKLKYISFDFATNLRLTANSVKKWFPPFQSTEYRQIPKAQQHIPLLHSAMKVWFSSI